MLHPIFSVLIRKPDLLAEHAAGYAALMKEELSATGTDLALKAAAWATVAVMGVIFVLFAGIACMLGAVQHEFHWALVVVPAVALVVAVGAFLYAKRPLEAGERFGEIKAQAQADMQALRLAGESS